MTDSAIASKTSAPSPYRGRFAPSPSGPLHFGSLIAATASYLDAKSHNGAWLVRIEDIDKPRCKAGAEEQILASLTAHGLLWDESIRRQSEHLAEYQHVLDELLSRHLAYGCRCTRKIIKQFGGAYPGTCRELALTGDGLAFRLRVREHVNQFEDRILGSVEINDAHALEDTVLRRRDGLFSYNFVVVLDDIAQGINHIVRGADLLETTAAHLTLYHYLQQSPPSYAHFPVAATQVGVKLSKQNHAPPIDNASALLNLHRALLFLGLNPPNSDEFADCAALLRWAIAAWDCEKVTKQREVIVTNG